MCLDRQMLALVGEERTGPLSDWERNQLAQLISDGRTTPAKEAPKLTA